MGKLMLTTFLLLPLISQIDAGGVRQGTDEEE